MKHPEIVNAEALVKNAEELVGEVRKSIRERNHADYEAAGGCLRCFGEGQVRHFDTYYPCMRLVEDDTANNAERWVPCEIPRGVRYGGDGPQHPADQRALDDALENLTVAKLTLRSCIAVHDVDVGVTVRVVKGRKVKVGTVGVVTGVYDGQWGMRVGIRVDGEPKPVYTALDNVLAISERFDGVNGLPDLYGTPKQVSWAKRLREDAIKSGRVSVDEARKNANACFWIDNRPKERAA